MRGHDLVLRVVCDYETMDLQGSACGMYMMWMSYGNGLVMAIAMMLDTWNGTACLSGSLMYELCLGGKIMRTSARM